MMPLPIRKLCSVFYIFLLYFLFTPYGVNQSFLENSIPQYLRTQKSDICLFLEQF